jgi:hypothetical protein
MSAIAIPTGEVRFHEMSFCDHSGRLFWWGQELYRGVTTRAEANFRKMFEQGTIDRLVAKSLLVDTELTDLRLDGYAMVLKHRRLPFVSYPFEWCFEMLRDAAICIIDLESELATDGLTNVDGNPWNVIFDGTHPVFVDLASIMPQSKAGNTLWLAYSEFLASFVYPLKAMSAGQDRLVRALLVDREKSITEEELQAILGESRLLRRTKGLVRRTCGTIHHRLPQALRWKWLSRIAQAHAAAERPPTTQERLSFLQAARREVLAIAAPNQSVNCSRDISKEEQRIISQALTAIQPACVLHLCHDDSGLATSIAGSISHMVTCSGSASEASAIYRFAAEHARNLVPLVVDFRFPSRGAGICGELAPATDRLRSETVIASNSLTHLVFNRSLRFEQISRGLADFCTRYAIVKFRPLDRALPDESRSSEGWRSHYSFYSLDNLVHALQSEFSDVSTIGQVEGDVLLLCRRKG